MSDLALVVVLAVWLACPILIWRAVYRRKSSQNNGPLACHVAGALSGGVALLPVVVATSLVATSGWLYPVAYACVAGCWYVGRRMAPPEPAADAAKSAPPAIPVSPKAVPPREPLAPWAADKPAAPAPVPVKASTPEPANPPAPAANPNAVSEAQFIARCEAMAADGWIDAGEAYQLQDLLRASPWLLANPRVGQLARLLDEALQDGEIDPVESVDLIALIEAIGGKVPPEQFSDWEPVGRLQKTRPLRGLVEGSKLDVIRFSYLNANRETSTRRLVVRMIDGERFAGRCLLRNAYRTFRLDRVQGLVTSELTGEVAGAMEWADGICEAHAEAAAKPRRYFGYSSDDFSTSGMTTAELKEVGALEIAFTGFPADQRDSLESLASDAGFIVRKSVTKRLDMLCAGPRAGASKLDKAQATGVSILTLDDFLDMVAESADS